MTLGFRTAWPRRSRFAQQPFRQPARGAPPGERRSSASNWNDCTEKRNDYAAFSIPEYWRFDPTGGQHHDAALAGEQLTDGVYQPIRIVQAYIERYRGHSEVLSLDLC